MLPNEAEMHQSAYIGGICSLYDKEEAIMKDEKDGVAMINLCGRDVEYIELQNSRVKKDPPEVVDRLRRVERHYREVIERFQEENRNLRRSLQCAEDAAAWLHRERVQDGRLRLQEMRMHDDLKILVRKLTGAWLATPNNEQHQRAVEALTVLAEAVQEPDNEI